MLLPGGVQQSTQTGLDKPVLPPSDVLVHVPVMLVFLVVTLFLETGSLQRSRIRRTGRKLVVSELSPKTTGMFGPISKLFSHVHRITVFRFLDTDVNARIECSKESRGGSRQIDKCLQTSLHKGLS